LPSAAMARLLFQLTSAIPLLPPCNPAENAPTAAADVRGRQLPALDTAATQGAEQDAADTPRRDHARDRR
jgi:hypothetical protein